jgi:hypothetical protein
MYGMERNRLKKNGKKQMHICGEGEGEGDGEG